MVIQFYIQRDLYIWNYDFLINISTFHTCAKHTVFNIKCDGLIRYLIYLTEEVSYKYNGKSSSRMYAITFGVNTGIYIYISHLDLSRASVQSESARHGIRE